MGMTCSKNDALDIVRKARSRASRQSIQRPPPSAEPSRPNFGGITGAQRNEDCQQLDPMELCAVRDQGIVVLVRIRPKSDKERPQRTFMEVQGMTQLLVPPSKITPTEKTMSFDAVLPERTTQEQVYEVAGPKLIQHVLQGFNATMIAYGQTGSGKTYTMEGSRENPGVIPRLCTGLFKVIRAKSSVRSVRVLATYVEIYQENVRDLLDSGATPSPRSSRKGSRAISPSSGSGGNSSLLDGGASGRGKGKAIIRENKEGVYIENAISRRVDNEAEILALLAKGASSRTTGETQMNAASSRSHAVLTLAVVQVPLEGKDNNKDSESGSDSEVNSSSSSSSSGSGRIGIIRSKISLVDLAGSERAKSTGAAGQRLKEGANINKSLSALGNVIKALTSGGGTHVPYRDSKLTRLLQDSLGGTAYTVVCCNVSPIEASESETLSTLRFAERLKKVKNKMIVHMDAKSKELLMLKRENEELRARVQYLEHVAGVSIEDAWTSPSPRRRTVGGGRGVLRRRSDGCGDEDAMWLRSASATSS